MPFYYKYNAEITNTRSIAGFKPLSSSENTEM